MGSQNIPTIDSSLKSLWRIDITYCDPLEPAYRVVASAGYLSPEDWSSAWSNIQPSPSGWAEYTLAADLVDAFGERLREIPISRSQAQALISYPLDTAIAESLDAPPTWLVDLLAARPKEMGRFHVLSQIQ